MSYMSKNDLLICLSLEVNLNVVIYDEQAMPKQTFSAIINPIYVADICW